MSHISTATVEAVYKRLVETQSCTIEDLQQDLSFLSEEQISRAIYVLGCTGRLIVYKTDTECIYLPKQ